MGKQGIGKCNSNGELLLALYSEFELIVTNTILKQKDERTATWMHPRSGHWHMIDFIITRCRDKMDIHSTRAMRTANCWTDHQMLRSKVAFRIGTSKARARNKLADQAHAGQLTGSFMMKTGRRQGCLLPPFLFLFPIDWIMEKTTKSRRNCIQCTPWSQLEDKDDLALLSHSHQQM